MNRAISHQPLLAWALLAITSAVLSGMAIAIARAPNGMALLWLASAPTAALLCVAPLRRWPALLAAQFVGIAAGSTLVGLSPATMIALTPFDLLEAACTAWLLRRAGVVEGALGTPRAIARFVLIAVLAVPSLTALGAGLSYWLVTGDPWSQSALRWPISHGLGMMVTFPLALKMVLGRLVDRMDEGGWLRLAAMFTLVFAITFLCFSQHRFPLLYLPILPLLVATLALGRSGAAVGLVAVAFGGGTSRLIYGGLPFLASLPAYGQLIYAAAYLTTLFGCALPVAAVIEQRTALRRRVARSEAHFRALAEASSDAFVTLTAEGRVRYGSNALRDLGGWEPADLLDADGTKLVHPDHRARVAAIHRAARHAPDEVFSVEYLMLSSIPGHSLWVESSMRAFTDPSDSEAAVLCITRDLSARKRREEELRRAADTDALTGLPNRATFRRAAEAALRRGEVGTLALLDLDHFKRINDRHGHAAGDTALKAVADLLREMVRGDDVVARYGGEEFAVLFRRLELADASRAADRLAERLAAAPIDIGRTHLTLTASIGLAALTPGETLDATLERTDGSLYAAKRAGRNRVMAAA